jgi:ribonuclease-3
VYLDGGFEAAAGVIERCSCRGSTGLPSAAELKDPKTRLQEALQARGLPLPAYASNPLPARRTISSSRCAARRRAGAEVSASGPSRRRAEQAAAQLS